MDQVTTTILFDGQFWIALIEKTDSDGSLYIGKHTFGQEPSNAQLLIFYLDYLVFITALKSNNYVRIKYRKSIKEQNRITCKSRIMYKKLQKEYLDQKTERKKTKGRR